MKKQRYSIIGLIIIAVVIFFSIKIYNDYREKDLNGSSPFSVEKTIY